MKRLIALSLLILPLTSHAQCRLDALQGDVAVTVGANLPRLERTLLYRATCDTETEAEFSVDVDASSGIKFTGAVGTLKGSVYVDGQGVRHHLGMQLNKDGRVIEVRVVVETEGLLPAVSDYMWPIKATLTY